MFFFYQSSTRNGHRGCLWNFSTSTWCDTIGVSHEIVHRQHCQGYHNENTTVQRAACWLLLWLPGTKGSKTSRFWLKFELVQQPLFCAVNAMIKETASLLVSYKSTYIHSVFNTNLFQPQPDPKRDSTVYCHTVPVIITTATRWRNVQPPKYSYDNLLHKLFFFFFFSMQTVSVKARDNLSILCEGTWWVDQKVNIKKLALLTFTQQLWKITYQLSQINTALWVTKYGIMTMTSLLNDL